jgi:hypothetical protein
MGNTILPEVDKGIDQYTESELLQMIENDRKQNEEKEEKKEEKDEEDPDCYDFITEIVDYNDVNLFTSYIRILVNSPTPYFFNVLDFLKINDIQELQVSTRLGVLLAIIHANVINGFARIVDFKKEIPEPKPNEEMYKAYLEYLERRKVPGNIIIKTINNLMSNMFFFMENQAVLVNGILLERTNKNKTKYIYQIYNNQIVTKYAKNEREFSVVKDEPNLKKLTVLPLLPIDEDEFNKINKNSGNKRQQYNNKSEMMNQEEKENVRRKDDIQKSNKKNRRNKNDHWKKQSQHNKKRFVEVEYPVNKNSADEQQKSTEVKQESKTIHNEMSAQYNEDEF